MATKTEPLDVWLRIDPCEHDSLPDACDCEDVVDAEANTFRDEDRFRVDWYLSAVGLVKSPPLFDTYEQARQWLEREGFQDFSS